MKLADWLDDRTGYRAAWRRVADRPVPSGAAMTRALGSALLAALVAQAVTGLALMTVYAPTTAAAWGSTFFLSHTLRGGWLLRGAHHFASHALLVLLALHLVVAIRARAHAPPREVAWWVVLARAGLVAGLAITGHVLPWDQKGYWARRVEMNIAGLAPWIGNDLKEALLAGPALGQIALTRFYALHVAALPILVALATVLHLALERRADVRAGLATEAYYPRQAARDAVAALLVLAVPVAIAVSVHGAPLGAPADPASDYPARPEWFLVPLFQLRKLFHGRMEFFGTAGVPLIVAAYLVALPWIDRAESAARGRIGMRKRVLAPLILVALATVAASVVAERADAKDVEYQKAQRRADARASLAMARARDGVPPGGPIEMLRRDGEARGEDVFAKSCATCHALGELGDPAKATAPRLDGWSTETWIRDLLHDPDADERFGRGPFREMMPSVDVAPKGRKAEDPPFKPMPDDEQRAVAAFLAASGDEPGDPPRVADDAMRAKGETIVRERCTTCHLYEGKGDDSSQEYAPELRGYGSLAWVRAQVSDPQSPATYREKARDEALKEHMPAFVGELAPEDLEIVARWVRAKARGLPIR